MPRKIFGEGNHCFCHLAVCNFLVKTWHEGVSHHDRIVDVKGRLVESSFVDCRQVKRGLKRDERACAQPEYVVRIGLIKNSVEVFDFFLYAVVVAERPAQTAAPPVWDVDGERLGQGSPELHKELRGTHGSVKENNTRATAQLPIANDGPVFRCY